MQDEFGNILSQRRILTDDTFGAGDSSIDHFNYLERMRSDSDAQHFSHPSVICDIPSSCNDDTGTCTVTDTGTCDVGSSTATDTGGTCGTSGD